MPGESVAKNNYRRFRGERDLARRGARKAPYDRVLVVCEGEKTEPSYLEDIRRRYRLSSAHISIVSSQYGTQPLQIVEYAIDEFNRRSRTFEWVFAVFDRDDHKTYHNALDKAKAFKSKLVNDEGKPVNFVSVPSVPCFEFWLLLHFANIQSFFHRKDILKKLKDHIKDYDKGMKGVFAITEPHIALASDRATSLRKRFGCHTGKDPYTYMDQLVRKLQGIRPLS